MPPRFSGPNYIYLQVDRECSGCGWDCYLKPDGALLSLKEAKEIVNLAKKSKIFLILIDGGDIVHWDGIYELINYVHSKSLMVGLVAKGEITEKEVKALARVRPNMIQVPLEGPEKLHDEIRGDGSYRKTLDALSEARNHSIEMHVGTTITRLNLPYIHEVSNALGNLTNLHRLIRYVPPNGKGSLAPDENMEVLDAVYDLRFNKRRATTMNNCYTFLIASKIKEKMTTKPQDFLGCVAGKTSLYITTEGYIVPCPMFSSKEIALRIEAPRIWEKNILEVWREWNFLEEIRKPCFYCQNCKYAAICGGCRAIAFHVYGNFKRDDGCPFQSHI